MKEAKVRIKNAVFTYENKEYKNKDLFLTFTDEVFDLGAPNFLSDIVNQKLGTSIPKQLYFGSPKDCPVLSEKIIENIRQKKGIKQYRNIKIACFL